MKKDQETTRIANPLLALDDLPLFTQIKPEHIGTAINELIATNRKAVEDLLSNNKKYSWENLIAPLEDLEDNLRQAWGIINHLSAVRDNTEWRKAHDTVLPSVTEYFTEMGQHEGLYKAYLSIQEGEEFEKLALAQKKVIENALRDFRLSGVILEKEKKERFKTLRKELSKLENKFAQNVLDAVDNWALHITEENKLKGLPEHIKAQAWRLAEKRNQDGWLITLDYPCYNAVMCYAEDRVLRKEVYKAYSTVASDQSAAGKQWDNGPLLVELLKIRQELSTLLGFKYYAEYALVTRMLKTGGEVLDFLNTLIAPLKTSALQELATLKTFAKTDYSITDIQAWDLRYLSERLREKDYSFSEEELRAYFPESQVLKGLFAVAKKLFGLTIRSLKEVDSWHDTVQFFEVLDEMQQVRGRFYLDLYARPHKKKGAWCGVCKTRKEKQDASLQTAVVYIVANFRSPSEGEKEALLSHDEVVTLFHEFGHCLHFILAKTNCPSLAPERGVAWDAIELPSQLMENWCWEEEAIHLLSKHEKSGEPLPLSLFSKLRGAKNFQIGLNMTRQLEFALFDFELHMQTEIQDYITVQNILDKVREKTTVVPVPHFNRFINSFSHIFSGSYAAGYYSYLWSEILSTDTFDLFKEDNKVFDAEIAKRFLQSILEPGGSQDFRELFITFRGRSPRVAALLKEWGLGASGSAL